jgi:hypothetical protein
LPLKSHGRNGFLLLLLWILVVALPGGILGGAFLMPSEQLNAIQLKISHALTIINLAQRNQ